MNINELYWEKSYTRPNTSISISREGKKTLAIWRDEITGLYEVFYGLGYHWTNLEPIAAQAVLYHLLAEVKQESG